MFSSSCYICMLLSLVIIAILSNGAVSDRTQSPSPPTAFPPNWSKLFFFSFFFSFYHSRFCFFFFYIFSSFYLFICRWVLEGRCSNFDPFLTYLSFFCSLLFRALSYFSIDNILSSTDKPSIQVYPRRFLLFFPLFLISPTYWSLRFTWCVTTITKEGLDKPLWARGQKIVYSTENQFACRYLPRGYWNQRKHETGICTIANEV